MWRPTLHSLQIGTEQLSQKNRNTWENTDIDGQISYVDKVRCPKPNQAVLRNRGTHFWSVEKFNTSAADQLYISSLYLLTILCVSIIKLHDAHFFKLRDCWCVLLISEADVEMRMQDEHINYKVMCHPFLLFLSQTELINEKRPWMKQKSSICMQYQEGSHVPRLLGELLRQKMNRMTKGHQN